jgi:serine O-acetyltransferase
VLGAIEVGRGSRVGANAVVVKPVPPESVVVGIPGQIVVRKKPYPEYDLNHGQLPDAIGDTLLALMSKVDAMESVLQTLIFSEDDIDGYDHREYPQYHYVPVGDDGVWQEDYSI